ncbi:caspase family protein [uncultured Roseibium sp.]|uniref:caspase family protein n=1 Tax=uncultured Roseibium sp. TaxID=1936171 RepID=UPI00260BCB13|nr:caspase family protein [uncultured Roseibium sp.]
MTSKTGPFLATLVLYFFLLPAAQAAQKALLIGVGDYPHLPPSAQLIGPANDLRAMSSFLQSHWKFTPSDIRILRDKDATKNNILSSISGWLANQTSPGDRVVIYYSGHGSHVPDRNGDEEDGEDETFVPYDYGRRGNVAEDMVLDDEIGKALSALPGREVILIADSCHSGTINRDIFGKEPANEADVRARYLPFGSGARSVPQTSRTEDPLARDAGSHITFSAALPHQLAWESRGYGIFTRNLIEGLSTGAADLNGNNRITSAELMNYIRPKTERWCKQVAQCRELQFTPNISPRNEAFILQPMLAGAPVQAVEWSAAEDVSDVVPELNSAEIRVDILPGNTHRIGDEVQFRLTSGLDGYLTLLDITAEEELVLLFPTDEDRQAGKTGRIRAGSVLTVPDPTYGFVFEAQAPAGTGRLLAIVTEDPVELEDLLREHGELEPISGKMIFLKELSARLNQPWTRDASNRSVRWASGYEDYQIKP